MKIVQSGQALPARWASTPGWCAAMLDLRHAPAVPLPVDWAPDPATYITAVPIADRDQPWMAFHQVTGADTPDGHTIVVTLHPGTRRHGRTGRHRADPATTAALVVTGLTLNDVWEALAGHGLDLRRVDGPTAAARIGAVRTGLLDPNSWAPGLSQADLSTDPHARADLAALLAVAHPRVPTAAAAAPLMHLHQTVGAADIARWLDSTTPLRDIPVLAEAFDDPGDCAPWVAAFGDAVTAALWRWYGPHGDPDRLARLHRAGWQPPTARAAVQMLNDHDRFPGYDPAEAAGWFANLPVPPYRALLVIRAGLSPGEMWSLIEKTPGGPDGIDWDALTLMGALRAHT